MAHGYGKREGGVDYQFMMEKHISIELKYSADLLKKRTKPGQ
jgi:hypothetical protein